MSSHFIKFTEQNNTGIIKLNRPDALNALNYEMAVDFLEILSGFFVPIFLISFDSDLIFVSYFIETAILGPFSSLDFRYSYAFLTEDKSYDLVVDLMSIFESDIKRKYSAIFRFSVHLTCGYG